MSRAAASLELHSQVVTSLDHQDALASSLEAVATLRSTIEGCDGLSGQVSLRSTIERIIHFVASACADGLPVPTVDSEPAWQLLATSISCGMELAEINTPEETTSSEMVTIPLSILSSTVGVLKAQP